MSFWGIIKLAFISLGRNKMRSFLTALGIIIGVTSVVAMVAVGQGAYFSVQENISKMGTNLIMVMPGGGSRRGFHGPRGSVTTLTAEDADAIARDCPSVGAVSPIVRNSGQVVLATGTGQPVSWVLMSTISASLRAKSSRAVTFRQPRSEAVIKSASLAVRLSKTFSAT